MVLDSGKLQAVFSSRLMKFFPQVDSTQDVALAWLREGVQSGAFVLADEQLKGRGRQGRTWHTPPDVALAISYILKPTAAGLTQVTMLGALAIAELLETIGATDVSIKWPNDVRLNGKKVSGVLPETLWDAEKLIGVALGMGVNVRVDFSDSDLTSSAISIEQALGRSFDRIELFSLLIDRVDYWSQHLASDELFKAWESRLDTIGQDVIIDNIIVNGTLQRIQGVAEAVDPQGALLVRQVDGTLQRVIAGDVLPGVN